MILMISFWSKSFVKNSIKEGTIFKKTFNTIFQKNCQKFWSGFLCEQNLKINRNYG